MWNFCACSLWPATSPTPMPTCTKIATSTATVNHHSARVRRLGQRCAARAHTPASPLPTITNQAQLLWSWSSSSEYRSPRSGLRNGRGRDCLRLGVGLGGDVDQLGDLFVAESGEPPEVTREVDGVLLLLTAETAEAEHLVDGLLEVESVLEPLRVLDGEATQPVGTHLTV